MSRESLRPGARTAHGGPRSQWFTHLVDLGAGGTLGLAQDHQHIPEIKTLAATIGKWQQPVIDAVLTGHSNAKAEAHNRTAKMVARTARGFASPHNQARRVRMATTRAARLARRDRQRRKTRTVARAP